MKKLLFLLLVLSAVVIFAHTSHQNLEHFKVAVKGPFTLYKEIFSDSSLHSSIFTGGSLWGLTGMNAMLVVYVAIFVLLVIMGFVKPGRKRGV